MKRTLATICLTLALLLGGCTTKGPNNLSTHYKNTSVSAELVHLGKIIDLNTFKIHKPNDQIIILGAVPDN